MYQTATRNGNPGFSRTPSSGLAVVPDSWDSGILLWVTLPPPIGSMGLFIRRSMFIVYTASFWFPRSRQPGWVVKVLHPSSEHWFASRSFDFKVTSKAKADMLLFQWAIQSLGAQA